MADNQQAAVRTKLKLYPYLPLILWVLLTVGTMFLFPRVGSFSFSEYTLGSISSEEIIAPFNFEILKSEAELETERTQARLSVEPVFIRYDSLATEQTENLRGTMGFLEWSRDTLRSYSRAETFQMEERRRTMLADVRERFGANLTIESWMYLLGDLRSRFQRTPPLTIDVLEPILRDLHARGIFNPETGGEFLEDQHVKIVFEGEERSVALADLFSLQQARSWSLDRLTEEFAQESQFDDQVVRVGFELLVSFIAPNIIYDSEETDRRVKTTIANVPLVKGIVLMNERVIDSNERVTMRHLELLHSMEEKRAELAQEGGGWSKILPWIARFILAGSIFWILGFWLYKFHQPLYSQPNKLLLFWTLTALMIAYYGLVIIRYDISDYLFPSALGAIIMTIVFNSRAAFIYTLALSLIIGALTGSNLFSLLATFLPAILSIFTVLRVRTRVQIMRASVMIFVGFLIVISVQRMLTYRIDFSVIYELLYAFGNALATPLIALGFLIVIEVVFRVTSDLTLLELADLNRPLLKRLSLEAPGTYHHSIMVGNLAEAAAEAIEANPLLVRAGSYYHDIGKMVRREYFIENQLGQGNIHDSINPEESAKMLADHVTQGLTIADEYRLPEVIRAFIREHHGTSLMMYFYNRALETMPEGSVHESGFRYPGPMPQSKETGILMLADSSEAATRSLEDPTRERILEEVRLVIIGKYSDGELDECPLTLHDLRKIMEAFVPILQGIHHHRIRYPSRTELENRPR